MRSFCAGVEVFPQPIPNRNPGGDCFACATTAAVRHFFGDRAPSFDQVWECFLNEQREADGSTTKHLLNSWPGYRSAFTKLTEYVGRLAIFPDFVMPEPDLDRYPCDWGVHIDDYTWARRLDAWLRSGHLALTSIRYEPSPTGEWALIDGKPSRQMTDHLVLLDGVRSGWRKHPTVDGAWSLEYHVHVVCSSRGGRAYWVDVRRFLREHGAGAWWLIRPAEEDAVRDFPEADA